MNSNLLKVRVKVVEVDRTALAVHDIKNQYNDLSEFLGYEPPIKFDNGEMKLKVKKFGLVPVDSVFIKTGDELTHVQSPEHFDQSFDTLKVIEPVKETKTKTKA